MTRVDLPVAVDVPAERFPAEIEASAYFIVAEALTNVVKHSNAESAEVGVGRGRHAPSARYATTGSEAPIPTVTGCWG